MLSHLAFRILHFTMTACLLCWYILNSSNTHVSRSKCWLLQMCIYIAEKTFKSKHKFSFIISIRPFAAFAIAFNFFFSVLFWIVVICNLSPIHEYWTEFAILHGCMYDLSVFHLNWIEKIRDMVKSSISFNQHYSTASWEIEKNKLLALWNLVEKLNQCCQWSIFTFWQIVENFLLKYPHCLWILHKH